MPFEPEFRFKNTDLPVTSNFLGGVCSIQLSYCDVFIFLSAPVVIGLSSQLRFFQGERCNATLGGGRSIQLSYGGIFVYFIGTSEQAAYALAPTLWWRRGELNPRPKTHPQKLLRAQTVILGVLLSLFPFPPASRHAWGSGELHDSWCGQSLPHARPPLNDA